MTAPWTRDQADDVENARLAKEARTHGLLLQRHVRTLTPTAEHVTMRIDCSWVDGEDDWTATIVEVLDAEGSPVGDLANMNALLDTKCHAWAFMIGETGTRALP